MYVCVPVLFVLVDSAKHAHTDTHTHFGAHSHAIRYSVYIQMHMYIFIYLFMHCFKPIPNVPRANSKCGLDGENLISTPSDGVIHARTHAQTLEVSHVTTHPSIYIQVVSM
jgi:hypothetical protein